MRRALAVASVLALGSPVFAAASDDLRFDGGIGSQPFANQGGAVVPNDVLGVPPGGRPWLIERLKADVKEDGRISVDGRGLILGGGANVGRPGNQQVRARLFCGGAVHDETDLVPLEANGDFRIDDIIAPLPAGGCLNAVLLIVNANGSWFAAGIPK